MKVKEKVIIRRVADCDLDLIRRVIGEGLEELGLTGRVQGRITIKPNVVMAHHKMAPSAFTRAEFLDGLIGVLEEKASGPSEIRVAEKCGAALPTSRMIRRAGYYRLKKKHRFRILPIEEARKKRVALTKGRIHRTLRSARVIVDRDFLVYAPKLKTNVLVQGLTAAIKLNVGILCDRERMWNHNHNLDEKIVDLLEVGRPDFIATDAIEISSGGNQLTQHGRPLGAVIMASNPVAHDAVCASLLNLDPERIEHIRIAHERGYGPIRLEDIEVTGDAGLEELRGKTKGLETGFVRADDLQSNIRIVSGEPYCRGGCHGVMLDWLYMIKDRNPRLWNKLPEWTVVAGRYAGDIKAERVMIIGSCSGVDGRLEAKRIRHIRGCPPKHKTLVFWWLLKAGIVSPLFRPDLIYDAYICLFFSWCRRLLKGRW
jgi:uncharacterized protein (DUF362 family)